MKMLTAVALAAMSVVIAGCGEKDDGTRKFTVGFDADFPPYGFKEGSEYKEVAQQPKVIDINKLK